MLEEALAIYNEQHKNNKIALTPQMKSEFQATNMIGVPFSVLPQVMAMSVTERDKFMGDMTNPQVGIPIDDNRNRDGRLNDFPVCSKLSTT